MTAVVAAAVLPAGPRRRAVGRALDVAAAPPWRRGRRRAPGRAAPAGPAGATSARCSSPLPRRPIRVGSRWAPSPGACTRPASWPSRPSRWWWWGRPRAGRPAPWPCRPFWAGKDRWWPPASRATCCATRWRRRAERGRSGASTPPGRPGCATSEWSPLTACGDWPGARRMAADLAETAKADGTTADGEFWYATAAKLLAPLFFAAALRRSLHGRRGALGRHPGGGRGVRHPRAGRRARSARGRAGLVVPRRADAQLGVHHGRDRAGALRRRRRPAPTPVPFEPADLLERAAHPVPLRARPTTSAGCAATSPR